MESLYIMKKHVTKIICAGIAAVVATSIVAASGCSPYNKGVRLKYTHSTVEATSNGGFAVEKDGYIYFINGIETNDANNDYGTPVKGSIMRISVDALDNGNYNSAETLVPQIAYSTASGYKTGIFVYGDYIYYGTPSTNRNSDGVIQRDKLEMKRTKLDGTESMKDSYVTFPTAAYDYRFVEENGVVYLLYVATGETLYDESTGVNNLHSYNTKTGKDTLLAYNVSNYMFDAEDKTNPRVYYTMDVYDYNGTTNTKYGYNQVYTVTADQTERNVYDTDSIIGWDKDSDRYINCGDLVFDGISKHGDDSTLTPFNYGWSVTEGVVKNDFSLTYTLQTYVKGTLFYTRVENITGSSSSSHLFTQKDSEIDENWNPVAGNPEDEKALSTEYSSSATYKYVFDDNDELKYALVAEGSNGVVVKEVEGGTLSKGNFVVRDGSVTMLFVDGDYLYYHRSGSGNGYSFYRVDYTGEWGDYEGWSVDNDTDYEPVRILDLDASTVSSWYMPELIGDYILFASETDSMSSYNYVMAFNLKLADMDGDGKVENREIKELNELYDGVIGEDGIISGYTDTDDYPTDLYANLANASRYIFYTADIDYVTKLAKACNAELEEGDDPVYSENTLNKLKDFLAAEGDWAEYHEYSRKVNGKDTFANRRDYYYSVIGKMTASDKNSYANDFKSDYLKDWPEEETQPTWFESLSKTARAFFIIGMCLVGILVIGGVTVAVIFIHRKANGNRLPRYTKRRINVDTTDDRDIDVYGNESE